MITVTRLRLPPLPAGAPRARRWREEAARATVARFLPPPPPLALVAAADALCRVIYTPFTRRLRRGNCGKTHDRCVPGACRVNGDAARGWRTGGNDLMGAVPADEWYHGTGEGVSLPCLVWNMGAAKLVKT